MDNTEYIIATNFHQAFTPYVMVTTRELGGGILFTVKLTLICNN